MTDFTIPCETFVRLASLVEDYQPPANRQELLCVYMRHKAGKSVAVSCCSTLAAFENLGATDQPDGDVYITIDPALVAQCKTEAGFGGSLTVQTNDVLQFATAKTTLGYVHPANAAIWSFDPRWFAALFDRVPTEKVKKQKGVMHWYVDRLVRLAKCAPSGRVFFPTIFDGSAPMILNDPIEPNWFGLFIPDMNEADEAKTDYKPAVLPDWFEK